LQLDPKILGPDELSQNLHHFESVLQKSLPRKFRHFIKKIKNERNKSKSAAKNPPFHFQIKFFFNRNSFFYFKFKIASVVLKANKISIFQ